MRGVAARYPAYDDAAGAVVDLEARINACRANRQHARPFARDVRRQRRCEARQGLRYDEYVREAPG